MKLRKILLALIITMFMSTGALASNQQIKIIIDGQPFKTAVPIQVVKGRTLVPVRAIFEKYGMDVTWNNSARTVEAIKDRGSQYSTITLLRIDYNAGIINNKIRHLDQPAIIINGHTMVPLRVISEALGFDIEWNSKNKTVVIKTDYNGSEKRTAYEKALDNFFEDGQLEAKMIKAYGSDRYNYGMSSVDMGFHDIDGDGTAELLLRATDGDAYTGLIYEFKNDKMNLLTGEFSSSYKVGNMYRETFFHNPNKREFYIMKSFRTYIEIYKYDKKSGEKLVYKHDEYDNGKKPDYVAPGFNVREMVEIEIKSFADL